MNRILLFCFFTLFACGSNSQKATTVLVQTQPEMINQDSILIKTLAAEFDAVNTLVRDNRIDKALALKEFQRILPQLQAAYNRLKPNTDKQERWIFPVAGYSSKAIGGTQGEGYIVGAYDYFDGNKYRGHPAHDIFIYDKNQDCKDDRTGEFVSVRAVTGGIVVALEKEWDSTSLLRGGKYIWIYAPLNNALFYYSHNREVLVNVGQIINAGDTVAIVGRTGLNAFKQRSPTHLHFMKLTLDNEFYPKPTNTYQELLHAKTD